MSKLEAGRLFETNALPMGCWKADGTLSHPNGALLLLLGYTRSEMESGRVKWTEITPAEYKAVDQKALGEINSAGSCSPFEKEYIRKDGKRIPVIVGAATHADGTKDEGVFYVVQLGAGRSNPGLQPAARRSAAAISTDVLSLTERQRLVCLLLSEGEPEKRIAKQLDIGLRTVELDKYRVAKLLKLPTSRVNIWAVENREALRAVLTQREDRRSR